MHPTGVATAAWVFASDPSKTPFYLAGGLLAAWAVLLGAFGVTHPDFPGSAAAVAARHADLGGARRGDCHDGGDHRRRGGHDRGRGPPPTGSAAPTSALNLSADPTGKLAYDKKQATVRAGRFPIRLVNNSSLPHNVTIAKGAKVLAQTKTISGGSATTTANLTPGEYVFYCSVDAHRAAGMQGTLTVK